MITRRVGLAAAFAAGLGLAGFAGAPSPASAQAAGPTVFAAASLKNALDDAAARWVAAGHPAPRISYAASNTLAQQIEQGAPAEPVLLGRPRLDG